MEKITQTTVSQLAKTNDYDYNLLKAAEECTELAEVLLKKVTKKGGLKEPSDASVIEEIGDVQIRINILTEMFGRGAVLDRIVYKMDKYRTYVEQELYTGKI